MDYQAQDYQPYLQSGCFYEASKAKDQEFICQPPKDWQNFYQGDWHCCLSPRPLAQQGWKIHLSVALGQEQEVLVPVQKQEEPAASQPQKAAQPAEEGEVQEKEEDKDQA